MRICLRYTFILIFICFIRTFSFNQEIANTGAIDEGGQSTLENGVTVWAVPAEQKVRPDDPVESDNLVWRDESNKIAVTGAGNDRIPFQVIITNTVAGSPRNVKNREGYFIEAEDLISTQGHSISHENIKFFLEHYILIEAPSSEVGDTGYWPDALVPLKVPFGMGAQYRVVKNRPIWVNLSVPSGTPGGKYSGRIYVTQYNKPIDTLELEVEVYNFSLPDRTPLITYMNLMRGQLARFYNKPTESEEIENLTQTYYEFLYANRMEPWFNDMLTPDVKVMGTKVELSFDDQRYLHYMEDLKTKRVLLNAFPGNLRRQVTAEPFSKEFNQILHSYLSQVEAYFLHHGWEAKLVFNSPIDEPRSLEEYEETRKWGELVHESTKDVPFLITRTPVPPKNHPNWGTFEGYVDNYSVHGNHMNNPALVPIIDKIKDNGGELTWYISCDQGYPQPNYFIDAPAMDLIMVPWITARYNMDGILYWALNYWSQTANPWLNANTFHSGFVCSGGWVLNGEGSVWYPGDYVNQFTGQPNVDGPVSSIRFELLREGIEDYVYLSMLDELGEEDFARQLVKNLVVDVSAFTRNVEKLYLTREAIARRLEELTNK